MQYIDRTGLLIPSPPLPPDYQHPKHTRYTVEFLLAVIRDDALNLFTSST